MPGRLCARHRHGNVPAVPCGPLLSRRRSASTTLPSRLALRGGQRRAGGLRLRGRTLGKRRRAVRGVRRGHVEGRQRERCLHHMRGEHSQPDSEHGPRRLSLSRRIHGRGRRAVRGVRDREVQARLGSSGLHRVLGEHEHARAGTRRRFGVCVCSWLRKRERGLCTMPGGSLQDHGRNRRVRGRLSALQREPRGQHQPRRLRLQRGLLGRCLKLELRGVPRRHPQRELGLGRVRRVRRQRNNPQGG